MAKFEIGEFAKSVGAAVSKLDTSQQLQYIDIDLLDENEGNFYELSNLQPLADSIAMDGLQQPLVVTPGKSGRYTLLSGHRRRAAIQLLLDEQDDPQLRRVPCMVRQYASPHLAQLQLILANSTARELTNAEKMRQAEQIETLLYQLKEEGYEFPGRMRDQVAAACKVSAPKLARLKVIREHLIPAYMDLFQRDNLPEQTAYALARMTTAFQERLLTVCPNPPSGYAAENLLKRYADGWRWQPDLQCPDGKVCRRGDTFLRHDAECSYGGDMCGGLTCCLNCEESKRSYSPCERMCSRAKALRKEGRDEWKEKEEEKKRKRQLELQTGIQASAARLLRAAEAAGLDDSVKLKFQDYQPQISVGELRSYAAGDFLGRYFYGNDLADFSHPADLARQLHCSTDYLYGLTDDLQPTAGPAEPEKLPPTTPGDIPEPDPGGDPAAPIAIWGWRNADDLPVEGQRAVVQKEYGDYVLSIFQDGRWIDMDMEGYNTVYETENVARWFPWSTPEKYQESVPSPAWRSAPPDRSRPIYGKFVIDGTEICQVAYYTSSTNSCSFGRYGASIEADLAAWVPLPEEEE